MRERIGIYPFHENRCGSQYVVPDDPLNKLRVDIEVFLRVTEHDDSGSLVPSRCRDGNDVTEAYFRTIVVFHA